MAALLAVGSALVWAVATLTYLLPPAQVYGDLLAGRPSRGEGVFIAVFTGLLALEFFFARHFFCRFACSVGVFQSLAWMANRAALVVGFRRERGAECATCDSACDHACPMRLRPRNIKRAMFTCTQCGLCVAACETTQRNNPRGPLLHWVSGAAARDNEAAFRAPRFERKHP